MNDKINLNIYFLNKIKQILLIVCVFLLFVVPAAKLFSQQSAYPGPDSHAIPGSIISSYFDNGGEGVSYHDYDPDNMADSSFRQEGVDCTPGVVCWFYGGEWLEYSVDVVSDGNYDIVIGVAAPDAGKQLNLSMDGVVIVSNIIIPQTGSWNIYENFTINNVALSKGQQILRLSTDTGDFNLGTITFITSGVITGNEVPGKIEAEDYGNGGEGTAYHDTTVGNYGGVYKNEDVDIQYNGEGGFNVGWIDPGEWLNYNINVVSNGSYTLKYRFASLDSDSTMNVLIDGTAVSILDITPTGNWINWEIKSISGINLTAGNHVLQLQTDEGKFNLDWIEFTLDLDEAYLRSTTSTSGGKYNGSMEVEPWDGTSSDIILEMNNEYQIISGWGGAFNENGWEALMSLNESDRNSVMSELFDSLNGAKFNICRIPIGITDFSLKYYSYNDTTDDYQMNNFNIDADLDFLIPYILKAQEINPALKVHASPWTPPIWMKTYPTWEGQYENQDVEINWTYDNLSAYALYFEKYIQAYRAEGVNLYAVFPQNEPGFITTGHPSCKWSGDQIREFIADYLKPEFDGLSSINNNTDSVNIEVWLGTFNRSNFNDDVLPSISDPAVQDYITGVGFQWDGANAMGETFDYYNNQGKIIGLMQTENVCHGGANSWNDAEDSFKKIIDYMDNYCQTYMYWNMILNTDYNRWLPRSQNSMITIDTQKKTVCYKPEFYVMKHFSYYIEPGAKRIGIRINNDDLLDRAAAFKNPDGSVIVVINNTTDNAITVPVIFVNKMISPVLKAKSFNTIKIGGPAESQDDWVPIFQSSGPYSQVEAENGILNGCQVEPTEDFGAGLNVGYISDGDSIVFSDLDFEIGAIRFKARVSSDRNIGEEAGVIELHLDSIDGPLIGILDVKGTGGWQVWETREIALDRTLTQNKICSLYVVFKGTGEYLLNLNWFSFDKPEGALSTFEAEDYDDYYGIQTEYCSQGNEGNLNIAYVDNNDYIAFKNLYFGWGATWFKAQIASMRDVNETAGYIEIRLGSPTGQLINSVEVTGTGGWQNWTEVSVYLDPSLTNDIMEDIYLVFKKEDWGALFNIDSFKFE